MRSRCDAVTVDTVGHMTARAEEITRVLVELLGVTAPTPSDLAVWLGLELTPESGAKPTVRGTRLIYNDVLPLLDQNAQIARAAAQHVLRRMRVSHECTARELAAAMFPAPMGPQLALAVCA